MGLLAKCAIVIAWYIASYPIAYFTTGLFNEVGLYWVTPMSSMTGLFVASVAYHLSSISKAQSSKPLDTER